MSKLNVFSAILGLLISFTVNAQQWKWAASAGGGGNTDQNYDMATDSRGNIYWVGSVSGTVTFGNTTITSPSSATIGFVAKYDSTGAFVWVRKISSNLSGYDIVTNAITIDTADRIFITGIFEGNANFDGGLTLSNGFSTQDMFVARISTAGVFQWAKKEGTSSYDDVGSEIASDDMGNAYVVGYRTSACYLWKFDSLGVKVWEKFPSLSGTVSSGKIRYDGITIKNGKLVACGYIYYISATFTGLPAIGNSSFPWTFLVEYDLNGNAQWSKAFKTNAEAYFYDVVRNSYGDLLVTGMFRGQFYLDNDTVSCSFSNNGDGVIAILDSVGNVKWSTSYGDASTNLDRVMQGAEAPGGRWYVCGQFYGTVNVCGQSLTSISNSSDLFIARLDPAGQLEWIKTGGSNQPDYPLCMHKPRTGKKLYCGGYYWGMVTYGSTTIDDVMNGDAFVAQISDTTTVQTLVDAQATSSCFNSCNGIVSFQAFGTGSMTYTLDTMQNTSGVFTGLCSGAYSYSVSNGTQTVSDSIDVTATDSMRIILSSQFNCGQPNFTINSAVSGGNAPYNYLWSNTNNTASISVSQDTASYYGLSVTDDNGCTVTDSILVEGYLQDQLMIVDQVDTLMVSGDTSGLDFVWELNGYLLNGTENEVYLQINLYGPGYYHLNITDSAGCSWTSDTVQVVFTSINESDLNETLIYPNPSTGSINIESKNVLENICIYNSLAELVYSEKITGVSYKVDLNGLKPGIYMLSVQGERATRYSRLIIQ